MLSLSVAELVILYVIHGIFGVNGHKFIRKNHFVQNKVLFFSGIEITSSDL